MHEEINLQDAKMMYQESLVLRKGIPVFIRSISPDYMVHAWNLVSQKFLRFKFNLKDLSPPSFRLGYVNIGTNCFYLTRTPIRVYKVGLSPNNIKIIRSEHPLNNAEEKIMLSTLRHLSSVALYKTIKGVYPGFQESIRQAKENEGCVAFDRQFAVDYKGSVYYRGKNVGFLEGNKIAFFEGKRYLSRNLPKGI